jgi:hypothetical protein
MISHPSFLAIVSTHQARSYLVTASGAQKAIKMDKAARTTTELEVLVLAALHAIPECGGAVHVTVIPYDDFRAASNWQVASFNPGVSEWGCCERALGAIVHGLQQRFELSP